MLTKCHISVLADSWKAIDSNLRFTFPYHCYTNLILKRLISLLILISFTYLLYGNAWNIYWVKWHGMADELPPRWDLGSGWHLVWWSPKIWLRVRLTFCQMFGCPNGIWLAGWLVIWKISCVYWCKRRSECHVTLANMGYWQAWLVIQIVNHLLYM